MDNQVAVAATNSTESFPSIAGLKSELKRLVDLVTIEDDCRLEVLDDISKTVTAIKDVKFTHNAVQTSVKTDPIAQYFVCPISSELMADPVVLASGQTYDRAYIQEWLDADHVTCPTTEQVLQHTTLTPNHLVRTIIEKWCHSKGLDPPTKSIKPTSDSDDVITPQEAKYVDNLLQKLSGHGQSQQREAARELRVLTRKKPSHRISLGRPKSLNVLISLLWSPDSETQEHAVTILLNLSIHNDNKALIAEEGGIHPIVEVLKNGSMAARENAAAALFSLSAVEENKARIGSSATAIPALINLMREGASRGKKDAASALFNLCIHESNKKMCVKAGLVPLLLKSTSMNEDEGGIGDDESLAILGLISRCEEGAKAIGEGRGVAVLVDVIVKETCGRNKENAVGIMVEVCSRDSRYVKEVKNGGGYMALVDLSLNGTCRARRKAKTLLDRINRQHRLATI